ncbi:MAG: hypothetical protein IMX00_11320 [Limnochordales bacterium]|nr:hypothetical protein [Limnochordales bacterium]
MRWERWLGIIFIFAGVYWLGVLRHWWPWIAFEHWIGLAFDYWPIWLILAGGLILLSPRWSLRSVLGLVLGLIILLLLLGLPSAFVVDVRPFAYRSWGLRLFETTLDYPRSPAPGEQVEVELDLAAGVVALDIGALGPADSPEKNLLRASLEYWRARPRVILDTAIGYGTGGGQVHRIEVKQGREGVGVDWVNLGFLRGRGAHWRLDLSPAAVWAVRAQTGASSCTWDFSRLPLSRLDVDAGAGSLDITLPDVTAWSAAGAPLPAQPIPVILEAGAVSLTVRVPEDAGVEVHLDTALSSHNLIEEGLVKDSAGRYVTEDFTTARLRYSIEADLGVTSFALERIPAGTLPPVSASI